MLVDSKKYQEVQAAYDEWLKERGLERSRQHGGVFSMSVTGGGTKRFLGLSEDQVNEVVDGDKRYTD
jgi:hypothetical protein